MFDSASDLQPGAEFAFWHRVPDTACQFGRAWQLTQRGRGWYNFNVLRGKVCYFRGMQCSLTWQVAHRTCCRAEANDKNGSKLSFGEAKNLGEARIFARSKCT